MYSEAAKAFVEDPSGTVTNAVTLAPEPPAGLAAAMEDCPALPNRSCTVTSWRPRTSDIFWAYLGLSCANTNSLNMVGSRFNMSTVTRAVAPPRQKRLPWQGEQSVLCIAPFVNVHWPSGQMLHEVDWKPLDQVPAGQAIQEATPPIGLYLPGSQLIHKEMFACPTAG